MATPRDKGYFTEDVPSKDRFVQRDAPEESDQFTGAVLADLVETMATQADLDALTDVVDGIALDLAATQTAVALRVTTAAFTAAIALKADKTVVDQLVIDVDALEIIVNDILTNYASKAFVASTYVSQITYNAAINALEANKLETSTFDAFQATVNDTLSTDVIYHTFNSTSDTLVLPFRTGYKTVVTDVRALGVVTWNLYASVGAAVSYANALSSTNLQYPFDPYSANNTTTGLVFEATSLQTMSAPMKPAVTITVRYVRL
jgi:hypothetical protein